jgi:hypothetical protein
MWEFSLYLRSTGRPIPLGKLQEASNDNALVVPYRAIPNPQIIGGAWAIEWTHEDGTLAGYFWDEFATAEAAEFRAAELRRLALKPSPTAHLRGRPISNEG